MVNGKWCLCMRVGPSLISRCFKVNAYSPFTIYHSLNLYPQNLPNDEHARKLHEAGGEQKVVTARVSPEDAHVFGVHDGDGERDEDGQAAQNPRGHARACRQRLQVFEYAEALAYRVCDLLKNLGEVPARLALNHDGRDAEPKV